MRKEHDCCTFTGCSRTHHARGLCLTHYMQRQRGSALSEVRTRTMDKPPECIEGGCAEPVKAKGLCKMHYQRLLRHGHTRYTDRKKPARICVIDGCDNLLYAKDLCHAHYAKQRKWEARGRRRTALPRDAARTERRLRYLPQSRNASRRAVWQTKGLGHRSLPQNGRCPSASLLVLQYRTRSF
jgi:hypothetical protein